MNPVHLLLTAVLAGLLTITLAACSGGPPAWTQAEKALIVSLSLSQLPALPPDSSNAVADNPAAAALGAELFADTRFSRNGKVACASCHLKDRQFQDDRPWGRKLRLPLFIKAGDGSLLPYSQQVDGLALGNSHRRRKLAAEAGRRPRFLNRRKPGESLS